MNGELIGSILQEINSIWFSIALVSILFFFFYVKVKFQKQATLKSYGILFYSFVFYAISAISFVLLNAMDQYLGLGHDLYSQFLWFFPFAFISAACGAAIGTLIYWTGLKIAEQEVFKLMNLSLFIIAPALVYTLLIQPYRQTLQMSMISQDVLQQKRETNLLGFIWQKDPQKGNYIPAIPTQLFDSLQIEIQSGNRLLVLDNSNGFTYAHPLPVYPVEQCYVVAIPQHKMLAILSITPAIQAESAISVMDSLGMLVYQKSFEAGVNRMSLSRDGKYLRFDKTTEEDSLEFMGTLQLQTLR